MAGPNNVFIASMGTELPGGASAPPFVFVGFADGAVNVAAVNDSSKALAVVKDKAGLVMVHYAVGEFCDVDGVPGFQGQWPPQSFSSDLSGFGTGSVKLQKDIFISAGLWSETTFSAVQKLSDNPITAAFSSAASVDNTSFYQLECHLGNSSEVVQGLTLGDYRLKCDVTLSPGPYRADRAWQNATLVETIATAIGCGKANRKIALLAFVAAAAVGANATGVTSAKWKAIAAGKAAFELANQFDVRFPNGTVVTTGNAVAQVFSIGALFPQSNMLPSWAAAISAVLVTFDVGQDVLSDPTMQLFYDPALGFGGNDPSAISAVLVTFDVGQDVLSDPTMQLFYDPALGFGGNDPSALAANDAGAPRALVTLVLVALFALLFRAL